MSMPASMLCICRESIPVLARRDRGSFESAFEVLRGVCTKHDQNTWQTERETCMREGR